MNSIKRVVTIAVLTMTSLSAGANDDFDNSVERAWLEAQLAQQAFFAELAEEQSHGAEDEQTPGMYEEVNCKPYPQCKGN